MKKLLIIFVFVLALSYTLCSNEGMKNLGSTGITLDNITSAPEPSTNITHEPLYNEDVRIPKVDPSLETVQPTMNPILTAENSLNIEHYNDYYEITNDNNDNYIITLYDMNKNIIDKFSFPKEPYIGVLETNILQISVNCGSPCRYIYFYDIETCDISDVYFNISLAEKGKVLYMEDGKFIISDIFDKTKYYKEIIRDFSPVAAECNDISEVKFLDDNTLLLNYLAGENFNEKHEIIELEESMISITPSVTPIQ